MEDVFLVPSLPDRFPYLRWLLELLSVNGPWLMIKKRKQRKGASEEKKVPGTNGIETNWT